MEKVSEKKEESKEPEDEENPTKKKVFQNF